MDINLLLDDIKSELGLYNLPLPEQANDEAIIKRITSSTIRSFSVAHSSFKLMVPVDISDGKYNRSMNATEFILPEFKNHYYISIKDMAYNNPLVNAQFDATYSAMTDLTDVASSIMMAYGDADVLSVCTKRPTFKFKFPNTVYVTGIPYMYTGGIITFECCMSHSKNLETIPPLSELDFTYLATLDTQIFLYGILKRYDGKETPGGSLNINIGDWSGAANEKREILKEWKSKYHIGESRIHFV